MKKIKILGWILLPLNIIGLCYCIWALQVEFHIIYLFGTGFFLVEAIYILKTFKVLERVEISNKRLESVVRKSGLIMVNLLKGRKES